MKRLFVVLALLCAGSSYAQDLQLITATTANTTYYVATTGSDSNACTVAALPCLTITGVLTKIPRIIRHQVTVSMAAGTYTGAGAWIAGFQFDNTGNGGAWLAMQGALVPATAASGSSSGTATAGTKGLINDASLNTVTVAAAGWTVDDFKGKLLKFTSGALSGANAKWYPIVGNTSTVITFSDLVAAAPAVGATFQVQDWGTIVDQTVGSYRMPSNYQAVTTPWAAWEVDNTGGEYENVFIRFIRFNAVNGGSGIQVDGPSSVGVMNCKFDGSSNFATVGMSGRVKVFFEDNAVDQTNSAIPAFTNIEYDQPNAPLPSSVYLRGNYVFGQGGTRHGYVVSGPSNFVNSTGNYYRDLERAFWVGSFASLYSTQDFFDNTAQGVTVSYGVDVASASATLSGDYFLNNSTVAVRADGRVSVTFDPATLSAGAGNAIGVWAADGATIQIQAATAIGAAVSTNEVKVDSTAETYATLRGATPAVLLDARTGARVYQ